MTVTRLRYLLRPREVSNRTNLQVLSVYRDHGVVPKNSRSDNFNKTPEDITRYQEVRVGDLVVNKMKSWQGSLGISGYHGIVSPDYLVCSVDPSAESRFLHHLLRSAPLVAQFGLRSKGIRPAQWRLYWDDLAEIPVTLPPPGEQRRIADFLDAETARIDGGISLIMQQAQVLEERYQAAVDAEIGQTNELIPLKYVATIVDTEHKTAPAVAGGGYWIAGTAAVHRGRIKHEALYETDLATFQEWTKRRRPRPGDVLLSREAPVGEIGLYRPHDPPLAIGQRMVLLSPERNFVSSEFLAWTLLSSRTRRFVDDVTQGSLHPHLNMSSIGSILVDRIPLTEQEDITQRLATITDELHALNEFRRAQLSLLTERNQALITAAVTGQMDVAAVHGLAPAGGAAI